MAKLTKYHSSLAFYFASKTLYLDEPTQKKPNIRKLVELPWQQTHGQLWKKLELLLSNLDFLETKSISGKAFDLLSDFQFAIETIPVDRLYLTILSKLYDAIKNDIIFIDEYKDSYPQAIFQCLWNSCWWYDHQGLNQDLSKIRENIQGLSTVSHEKINTPKLYKILENWRKEREAKYPGFVWIRNLIPDVQRLTQHSWLRNFKWHNGTVYDIAISDENKVLVSCSADSNICIWDINSDLPPKVLSGHSDIVVKVSVRKNGEIAISASKDNTIRIWDIRNLREIGRITNLTIQDYYGLSLSEDANFAAVLSGSTKNLEIFDLESRLLIGALPIFNVHSSIVLGRVCFSPENKFLACCGSNDNLISIWEINTGKLHSVIDCGEDDIEDIAFFRQRNQIISCAIDGKIKLWSFSGHSTLSQNDYTISTDLKRNTTRIAISPNNHILGIVNNENIIICNAENFEILNIISTHDDDLETIIFDHSNKFVLTGGQDKSIHINDYSKSKKGNYEDSNVIKYQNLLISKNRKTLVVSSNSGIQLLDPYDLTPILNLKLTKDSEPYTSLEAISGDGKIITTICNGHVTLWDAISGEVSSIIKTNIGKTRRALISISYHGNLILLACDSIESNLFRERLMKTKPLKYDDYSNEANIFLWKKHLNGWKLERSISLGSDCIVSGVTMSENGEMWAISYYKLSDKIECIISIWSKEQKINPTIIKTTNSVSQLEFCLENKKIAGLQNDLLRDKMCIWDVESGETFLERIGSGDIIFFAESLTSPLYMSIKLAHEIIFADVIREIRIAAINDSIMKMVQGITVRHCLGIKYGNLYGFYLEGNISRNKKDLNQNSNILKG